MKIKILIAVVYSGLLLSACATMTSPEQAVTARANARINLVIAGEILKAYDYLSPGYRSSVSPEAYLADMVSRRITWTKSEQLGTTCTENRCIVRIKVDYRVISPVPGVRKFELFDTFEENWVNTRGQWWYVPKI